MFLLIWSLVGLSCVSNSLGVVDPFQQSVPQFSAFQPSAYQFNQPATPFNPAAVPANHPAAQSPAPVNPGSNAYQPSFQVPNQFQGQQTPPSSFNNQPCKCKFTDVVKNFKRNFIQSISSSQKYIDAFNLKRVSKGRAAHIWFERIREESIRAGEKDPEFSAFSNAQAVKDNYEYIDSDYQLKVFGYSLGEYLYQKRVLTADNVLELSEKLAQTMKDSIDEKANPTSEDNLYAILKGCERFLSSLSAEDLSWACDAIFGELFYILKNCRNEEVSL